MSHAEARRRGGEGRSEENVSISLAASCALRAPGQQVVRATQDG